MRTRSDYLEGRCTHQEYYLDIASGLHLTANSELLQWVRQSRDPHLNDIPLRRWDSIAAFLQHSPKLKEAFKARGDFVSAAGMVSLLKVFYLDAATK
jgi:hypothetical protein